MSYRETRTAASETTGTSIAKPTDYKMPTYGIRDPVPPIYEVMGSLRIGDTGLTVAGGSLPEVMAQLENEARERGADALQIEWVKEPDFVSTIYRVQADLLRKSGSWRTISRSEEEVIAYLDANGGNLDGVEGIWTDIDNVYRVAIIRDPDKSKRDFVAVVLDSDVPGWEAGYAKMELSKAATDGVFVIDYYDALFRKLGGTMIVDEASLSTARFNDVQGQPQEVSWVRLYPEVTGRTAEAVPSPGSSGSGFIFHASGLVGTNWHVVKDSTDIRVVLPSSGREYRALARSLDSANDLAILELVDFDPESAGLGGHALPLRPTASVTIADKVFTLGYPLSDALSSGVKYTEGVVSAVRGLENDPRLLQVTVPIQPGNSGGPLLDQTGNVVGVIVSTLSPAYVMRTQGTLPQSVNFAIKADYLIGLSALEGIDLNAANAPSPSTTGNVVAAVEPFVVRIIAK